MGARPVNEKPCASVSGKNSGRHSSALPVTSVSCPSKLTRWPGLPGWQAHSNRQDIRLTAGDDEDRARALLAKGRHSGVKGFQVIGGPANTGRHHLCQSIGKGSGRREHNHASVCERSHTNLVLASSKLPAKLQGVFQMVRASARSVKRTGSAHQQHHPHGSGLTRQRAAEGLIVLLWTLR